MTIFRYMTLAALALFLTACGSSDNTETTESEALNNAESFVAYDENLKGDVLLASEQYYDAFASVCNINHTNVGLCTEDCVSRDIALLNICNKAASKSDCLEGRAEKNAFAVCMTLCGSTWKLHKTYENILRDFCQAERHQPID